LARADIANPCIQRCVEVAMVLERQRPFPMQPPRVVFRV
jgi:hypothetical protein